VKGTACGNDFLIIDGMHAPADLPGFTRRICHRYLGVGADGVEWLFPAQDADIRARLLNADGSEAEISGNGTRCVAAYLVQQRGQGEKITVRTGAGIKTCRLLHREETTFEFEMAMGEPQVGEPFPIKLAFNQVSGIPVSMGNPHYCIFVDDFAAGWQAEAAEIGRHHDFKHGINVELVRVRDPHMVEVRIFERGVGETQSSGTGSCAAAVAAIASKRAQLTVTVKGPGGAQTVRWEGEVFLQGTAVIVCKGNYFY